MKTLLHLLYKDFLLLIRDKAGLLLLFVMPMVLVLIMTSLQEGVFSVETNTNMPLLVINDDCDSIGNTMENVLRKSDVFDTHTAKDVDSLMNEDDLKKLIANGNYVVGIYIPDSTTARFTDNFKNRLENAFTGKCKNSINHSNDSLFIRVYIDPTVKPSVHSTLMSNIREFTMHIQNEYSLKSISKILEAISGNKIKNIDLAHCKGLTIDEQITDKSGKDGLWPSPVQHSVPAWTIFAIFFIVISFSGNIINEREDGSFDRLMTMPCSFANYLFSKMLLYLLVCILQFLAVLAMGIWLFPLIGLDTFVINGYFFKLLFVVFFAACAAIGFGTAISAIATTQQQAAIFGSVSVVILAAIGGIWVPTFTMPHFFKCLSHFSPLNWGLESSYDIILRKSPLIDVLPECMYLFIFALVCFGIAYFYKKRKTS